MELGRVPRRKPVLLVPRGDIANERILDYWAQHTVVLRSPSLCRFLERMHRAPWARFVPDMTKYMVAIDETAGFVSVYREWGDRPALLALRKEDVARGTSELERLGLPQGARFVCVHSREGGYSPSDEHWHEFRNSHIETYLEAVRLLRERGVYTVRMGDPSMRRLPPIEGMVDYAHSDARADWMDVFLCGRCEFFLGNSSGLFFVSKAFGRPVALANMAPLSSVLATGGSTDLGIPKLLRNRATGELMKFQEIFDSPIANFRFAEQFARQGLDVVDNSSEEIRDLALEMLDRLERRMTYSQSDEDAQTRFKKMMRPGHSTYGSASRIGREFLRKHAHLLH